MSSVGRFRKFLNKIYKRYIIVVYNESNLQEKISVKLTPVNVFFILTILVATTFFLSSLLFIFTPLKEVIPLFTEKVNSIDPREYRALQGKYDSLERSYRNLLKVEENLRQILSGESYRYLPGRFSAGKAEAKTLYHFAGYTQETQPSFPSEFAKTKPNSGIPFLYPPVKGYISKRFNIAHEHYGIDIAAGEDAPVISVLDGYIVFSELSASTGNVIIVQHSNDLISVYKHNSVLLKKTGNFVRAGEVIALAGSSGEFTSGIHLHFELWSKGFALDPENFINFD